MTIRSKMLSMLLALAVIPAATLGLFGFFDAKRDAERTTLAGLENAADLAAARLTQIGQDLGRHGSVLADSLEVKLFLTEPVARRSRLTVQLAAELESAQRDRGYVNVFLADTEGDIAYSVAKDVPHSAMTERLANFDEWPRDVGKSLLAIAESNVSGSGERDHTLLAVTPVADDAVLLGWTILEMDMEPFLALVGNAAALGETGETLVVARMADRIMHLSHLQDEQVPAIELTAVPDEGTAALPVREALLGHNGSGQAIDYRGENVLAAWRHVPNLGVGIVAKLDASEAFASAAAFKRISLALLGVLLIVVSPVALVVSRTITKPIEALETGTSIIGSGNLDHVSGRTSDDEVGRLSRAFDRMTLNLRSNTASREDLVQEIRQRTQLEEERAVLAEIGRIIGSTMDLDHAYPLIIEQAGKLIAFERMTINLIDIDEGVARVAYFQGPSVPGREVGATMPLEGSLTGHVARTGASALLSAKDTDEVRDLYPYTRPVLQAGFQSTVALPMISRDTTYGVLIFSTTRPAGFDTEDLRLAGRVADQISGAIEKADLIAARRTADESQRESETRYRLLAENALDVIWIRDLDMKLQYISPSVENMRGYTVDHLMAFATEQESTDSSIRQIRALVEIELALERDESKTPSGFETFESEFVHRDGSIVWGETRMGFLRDSTGKPTALLGVTRDVTERRQLQTQLVQSQKMEALGRLAGGVAHDFNNLLTPIITYAEIGRSLTLPMDRLNGYLREIQNAGELGAHLTGQLLAFSRRQAIETTAFAPNAPFLRIEGMLRRTIGENIELVFVPADDVGMVEGDPGQIEQILFNLVLNARDAMPTGGRLILEMANVSLDLEFVRQHPQARVGEYVTISVSDTGAGMTPDVMARVFEPFFTTKEMGRGTGLGLATCYGIVTDAGGFITVESELGVGTVFGVYLPRVFEEPGGADQPSESGTLLQGEETLLLVEDEGVVRTAMADVLRLQGYAVLEAADAEEALRIAHRHAEDEIQLLVTDVVLPKVNGIELAERLQSQRPAMGVLFTSGYPNEVIARHGVLDKGTPFLQKPFDKSVLVRKVQDALARTGGDADA